MKTEWTKDERRALAEKLDEIRGADLDSDEIAALEDAIAIICPEYAAALEEDEQEIADTYIALQVMDEMEKEGKD